MNTHDMEVLRQAYEAWMGGNVLRQARSRNKRFTFGDQWGDVTLGADRQRITDWERFTAAGTTPVTNNLLRQLVKTVVGRFRSQVIDAETVADKTLRQIKDDNQLAELDARALEEFLISGCAVQRVDGVTAIDGTEHIEVSNVNPNQFFVNAFFDPRARDCRVVGQLHDLTMAQLLRRVSDGTRRKAAAVRRVYEQMMDSRIAGCATQLGADSQSGTDFWYCRDSDPGENAYGPNPKENELY